MDNYSQGEQMKSSKHRLPKLSYNAPVVLTFTLISLVALLLDRVTDGKTNHLLFSVYRSKFSLFFIFRLFGHALGHGNWAHFSGNMTLFLLLGPILEEKYGSKNLLEMISITALISGIVNIVFFPNVALLGASGIVFMMILLASATHTKDNGIPITMILIAIIYIGAEVIAIFKQDNVSQLTHIIGGLCGALFGFIYKNEDKK